MSVASATLPVFEVDLRRESRGAGAPAKNHQAITVSNIAQPAEEVGLQGQIGVAYK